MPKRKYSVLLCTFYLLLFTFLSACTGQSNNATATPVAVVKVLATVFMSPTPNSEDIAATRAAISPTPIPPTSTIIPTETPYVGIFIGEAEQERGLVEITAPILGASAANPDEIVRIQQPTADVNLCPLAIDNPYLTAWRTNAIVNQRMGCPIQESFGFFGNIQVFERGVMYYYPELNAIWAIRPMQDNDNRGRYDYLENPPDGSTIGMQAEAGLFLPDGVLGDMWLAVSGLREEMGFARTEAQETPMGIQRFANGIFIHDVLAGQVYALIVDGTVLGPYLAPEAIAVTATPVVSLEANNTSSSETGN
jgi:hypothetical protein